MPSETPLRSILREEIQAHDRISFARFMELCLYDPRYGYYNAPGIKLGKAGDFYTSAHTGPLLARLLAGYLETLWKQMGQPARFELTELGPGDGQLAGELLPWTKRRFPEFAPHLHYTAVEQSAALRAAVASSLRQFGGRVRVLATLPPPSAVPAGQSKVCGCVFANEFFDALPFHILRWRGGRWNENYVCQNGDDALVWCQEGVSSRALMDQADLFFDPKLPLAEREEGRVAEIALSAIDWMTRIGHWLGRGEVLIIDYGYTRAEWREGRFAQGSALAYRKHRVVEDLLANPGEQDLTAHVNFSPLISTGRRNGLELYSLLAQEKFLMELGEPDEFQDLFVDCVSEEERVRRGLLLKNLLLPQAMGRAFQVLRMRKGMAKEFSRPQPPG